MNNPKEGRIGTRRTRKGAAIGPLLIGLRKTATRVWVAVFVLFWLAPQGHGWDSLFGLKSLNDKDATELRGFSAHGVSDRTSVQNHEPIDYRNPDLQPTEISPRELYQLMQKSPTLQLIDVRTPNEYAQGHIPGANNVSSEDVAAFLQEGWIDKNRPVVFVCASGIRSRMAGILAIQDGYREVYSLSGGMDEWIHAGFPVEQEGL